MRPRFPLSHRACHQKTEDDEGENQTRKEGGLSTAIINKNPRPTLQFLVVATPQF